MKTSSRIISREKVLDQKVTQQYLYTLSELYKDSRQKYIKQIKSDLNRMHNKQQDK